jgi:ABC-type lipoprotein release transport system permease subunit
MKDYLKIAWRSLWRNSRRTLITSASIFFGIFFSVFMTSLQRGSFENMIDNMVRFYSGYIQIQAIDFKDTHSINHSFEPDQELIDQIDKNAYVTQSTQRIESFALAGSEENSFPSLLLGINPNKEDRISGLSKWVGEGEFLHPDSKDILVGNILADNLGLGVNDSIILIGQGYHGVSAAGIYRIGGLLDFPLPDLSKQVVYMDIKNCQDFLNLQNQITSFVIMVGSPDDVSPAVSVVKPELNNDLKIYSWDELQPELESLIDGKVASGKIVKVLLFMIIGFGVWATIIMLMHERKRELGVMIAIGFQKFKIVIMILLESFFIGLIGILAGIAGSFPLMWYLYNNPIHVTGQMAETYESLGFEPIIKFSISPDIFINPAITVFIIFAVISLYEIWYVVKLKTVNALRA